MMKLNKEVVIDRLYFLICFSLIFLTGFAFGYIQHDPVVNETPVIINIHQGTADTSKTPEVEVVPEETEKDNTRTYSVTPPEELSPVDNADYDKKRFKFTPIKTKDTDELRAEVYETDESLVPMVWTHDGGSYVD